MKNKIFSLLIAVLLSSSFFAGVIAEDNLLINGDFEIMEEGKNTPKNWMPGKSSVLSSDYLEVTDEEAYSGKYSVKAVTGNDNEKTPRIVWRQDIIATPGASYTFTAYVKAQSSSAYGARLRVLDDKYADVAISKQHITNTKGKWEKMELTAVCPSDVTKLGFKLRWDGKGTVYFDNAVVTSAGHKAVVVSEAAESQNTKGDIVLDAVSTSDVGNAEGNLISNFGFENVTNSIPNGWSAFQGWNSGFAAVVSNQHKSGNNALKLETDEAVAGSQVIQSWVSYNVEGVIEGAKYTVSAWLLTNTIKGRGAKFSYEFYKSPNGGAENWNGSGVMGSYELGMVGAWMKMEDVVTIPEGTKMLKIYLRLYDAGTIYYDDASCVLASAGNRIKLETDNIFYYSDLSKGTAEVTLNNTSYSYDFNPIIDFKLKKGDEIIFKQLSTPIIKKALFTFDVSMLAKKGEDYTVEASIRETTAGEVLEVQTLLIARYDRPTALNKKGQFIKKDKSVLNPTLAWHVDKSQFADALKAGINVVQSNTINNIVEQLESAKAAGMMIAVQMYADGYREPTEKGIQLVTNLVNKVKDHPALFGYLIDDEPAQRLSSGIEESLRVRYKTIRDIDPHHPVLLVEQKKDMYAWAAKYCDIFSYDDYLLGVRGLDTFKNSMRSALSAVNYQKPVIGLMQCKVVSADYEPSIDEIRHMAYQSVWAGGNGFAYYALQEGSGFDVRTTAVWPGMLKFKQSGEIDFLNQTFVEEKFTTLNENIDGNVWYKTVIDGSKAYLIAMNLTGDGQNISIPLSGAKAAVQIGEYTGDVLYGGISNPISGTDAVSISLKKYQTVVYKITPKVMPDTAALNHQTFADLEQFLWAGNEVEALADKGIVNKTSRKTFSPGAKITRADFAMFLIRALGLEAEETMQFADVSGYEYYAKELAVGKALGILQGVGDEKFNPKSEISRQDMMVICARGMNAVKTMPVESKESLAVFSDSAAVADYAMLDIASMVREGIVKGNADGTINPLGNATRAEAAVIMSRIIEWSFSP